MHIYQFLLPWYLKNKRDLPWRNISNPYYIWVSEIVLQQTRVNQGLEYYNKFIARFPNIQSLAEASEDDVLKHWEGLGYYSRARNLKHAASDIMNRFDGKFPEEYEQILSLKGVGPYTAAAIASFAFGKKHAVVDGNVYRVLARVYGIEHTSDSSQGKKIGFQLANEIIHPNEPALHNQGMMELGALVCTPVNPLCEACPLSTVCFAYKHTQTDRFPLKGAKKSIQERFLAYAQIYTSDGFTFINRRGSEDIWAGLYEFPLVELASRPDSELQILEKLNEELNLPESIVITNIHGPFKHILTHRHLFGWFVSVKLSEDTAFMPNKKWERIPVDSLTEYAFPRLITRYLDSEKKD